MDKIRDKPHEDFYKNTNLLNPPPKLSPPSPPSNITSPTHEFSFTISLQPTSSSAAATHKSKAAVDLSPADEIFFHGHLLPLHLLSHIPPISPRTSTNSLDSLTLPVKSIAAADIHEKTKSKSFSFGHPHRNNVIDSKDRPIKSKSFSFMSIPRWRRDQREQIIMIRDKQSHNRNQNQNQNQNQKKRLRFDIGHVVKRYIRMVRPLILSFRGRREKTQLRRQPYSFSGNIAGGSRRNSGGGPGRRDCSSAPASMRNSPGNSGLLVQTPTTSTSDHSTMEELQAAIQAAIAHCKNSISTEDQKIKAVDDN
ncbi:BRI1 kinase inhibitor 1-like [Impatiens glandulifera]|uniref:BRI1 kinase inhibitor 1-like n=1 Tax=Impatiens glandulifera TaxID=253017 RepID=UPI001FB07A12|nr:BRI1 kinase inhibitor 1-like [Impatiens glandulifera]